MTVGKDVGAILLRVPSQVLLLFKPLLQFIFGLKSSSTFVGRNLGLFKSTIHFFLQHLHFIRLLNQIVYGFAVKLAFPR